MKTSEEIREYTRNHQEKLWLLLEAGDEYIVARCSFLNGLNHGVILAAQAIEKQLKANILFWDDSITPDQLRRSYSHHISQLAQLVTERYSLDLSSHAYIVNFLEEVYAARYDMRKLPPQGISSEELDKIDSLMILLVENLNVLPDIKFRVGLYASIFEVMPSWRHVQHWATHRNKAFEAMYPDFSTISKLDI